MNVSTDVRRSLWVLVKKDFKASNKTTDSHRTDVLFSCSWGHVRLERHGVTKLICTSPEIPVINEPGFPLNFCFVVTDQCNTHKIFAANGSNSDNQMQSHSSRIVSTVLLVAIWVGVS